MQEMDNRNDLTDEEPEVIDYGTLLELTQSGHVSHSDVPAGTPNTAFPAGPS